MNEPKRKILKCGCEIEPSYWTLHKADKSMVTSKLINKTCDRWVNEILQIARKRKPRFTIMDIFFNLEHNKEVKENFLKGISEELGETYVAWSYKMSFRFCKCEKHRKVFNTDPLHKL